MRAPILALAACLLTTGLALSSAPALARTAHAATVVKPAYTVRPTDVKASPYTDARTLSSLPTNARVDIIGRRGGWNKIKVGNTTGWVKMLSLRLAQSTAQRGDTGFRTLFNVASTGGSGSTSTTGVRGLSEEKLNNPHPNPHELEYMHTLEVSKAEAQRFASAGHLKAEHMNYLPAPGQ